jgi:lipopolysaccharide transport system ATP-binding protein
MSIVISVENLSKTYRLGQIGTGTFTHDLNVWWAKLRGKPNPLLRIGEADHGNRDGEELMALRDVSFTVQQGEVLGIIGKNGAGKSTLLKILSRVTAPTSGVIKVKGRIASLLEVGTGFHPELTGRENIYLNGAILGMTKQEVTRKFDEIVDFAGVEKFIDTPVKRYSSGMYVRLAFAVAAHLDPEILVVDEVLAVGDAEFQKKCLGKMHEVAQGGRTVLFVSHNMTAVLHLCTTVIMLSNGSISEQGDTKSVTQRYSEISIQPKVNSRVANSTDSRYVSFTSIKIFNEANIEGGSIQMGESFYIEICANAKQREPIEFSVMIKDIYGKTIVHSIDRDDNFQANENSGNYHFRVKFSAVYLYPGQYVLSFWCGNGDTCYDYIREHSLITVEQGRVSSRMSPMKQNQSLFFIPTKWENIN